MGKWTAYSKCVSYSIGSNGWADIVVSPCGREMTVDHQSIRTGDVKTKSLGGGMVEHRLVNPVKNPVATPGNLARFIVDACNAYKPVARRQQRPTR